MFAKSVYFFCLLVMVCSGGCRAGEVPGILGNRDFDDAEEARKEPIKKIRKKKPKKTEQELQRKDEQQLRAEEKRTTKKERERLIQNWKEVRRKKLKDGEFKGKFASLYPVAATPAKAWPFRSPTLLNTSFAYREASTAYARNGDRCGLARKVFGAQSFRLRDILLESDLSARGLLAQHVQVDSVQLEPEDEFLALLADTHIRLDARIQAWTLGFDVIRKLGSEDFAIGVHVPLEYKRHKLAIDIDPPKTAFDHMTKTTKREDSSCGTVFRTAYRGEPALFFKDLLARKKLLHRQRDSEFGPGDISFFARLQMHSHNFNTIMLGISGQAPTGRRRDVCRLWGPELGAGVPSISLYMSALKTLDYKINPYIFAECTFHLTDHVKRRLSRRVMFDGNTLNDATESQTAADGQTTQQQFSFGEFVAFEKDMPFNQLDTCLRRFSDRAYRVRYSPGVKVDVRIGNVWEKFIFRSAFLDIFYHFSLKQRDKISVAQQCQFLCTDIETRNTEQHSHTFGFDFSYQFDKNSRTRIGLTYVAAGQNAIEDLELLVQYAVDF